MFRCMRARLYGHVRACVYACKMCGPRTVSRIDRLRLHALQTHAQASANPGLVMMQSLASSSTTKPAHANRSPGAAVRLPPTTTPPWRPAATPAPKFVSMCLYTGLVYVPAQSQPSVWSVCLVGLGASCFPRGLTPRDLAARCNQPKQVGPCESAVDRYYYDQATGQCATFVWGGCSANPNNFATLQECQGACVDEGGHACIHAHGACLPVPLSQPWKSAALHMHSCTHGYGDETWFLMYMHACMHAEVLELQRRPQLCVPQVYH